MCCIFKNGTEKKRVKKNKIKCSHYLFPIFKIIFLSSMEPQK